MTKHRGHMRKIISYRVIGSSLFCQIDIGADMTHFVKTAHTPWTIPTSPAVITIAGMRGGMRLQGVA